MLYPLKPCETQPLIDVSNITVRNVQQYGNILPPGVLRCHESNPCTGFTFQNVNASGWWKWLGIGYITQNVQGLVESSKPAPAFNDLSGKIAFIDEESSNNHSFGTIDIDLVSTIEN